MNNELIELGVMQSPQGSGIDQSSTYEAAQWSKHQGPKVSMFAKKAGSEESVELGTQVIEIR